MTRYFQVHIINVDSFMAVSSVTYLPKENDPDGYLLLILNNHKEKDTVIKQHFEELKDPSVTVSYTHLDVYKRQTPSSARRLSLSRRMGTAWSARTRCV